MQHRYEQTITAEPNYSLILAKFEQFLYLV
jgi:hypothetical protein